MAIEMNVDRDYSAIRGKLVMVAINIGMPELTKQDKEETKKVLDDTGAKKGQVRVSKNLYPKESLKKLLQISRAARAYRTDHSIPYFRGMGLLPNKMVLEFMLKMAEFEREFNLEADNFANEYDEIERKSRSDLGSAYDPGDYHHRSNVRRKFQFEVQVLPMPTPTALEKTLDGQISYQLETALRKKIEAQIDGTVELCTDKLIPVVQKLAKTLADEDARFHKTLFTNVAEMCELVENFNITGNANIDEFRQACSALSSFSAETCRTNPIYRKQVAENASKVLDKMQEFRDAMAGAVI